MANHDAGSNDEGHHPSHECFMADVHSEGSNDDGAEGKQKRTELSNVTDADIIGAFLAGTSCRSLVHELGRVGPRTTKELLDTATYFASGEEAIGAIFDRSKGKAKREEDADEGASTRRKKKKAAAEPRRLRRGSSTTTDEDDDDEDEDDDEESSSAL
nr:uncharacterized protein LOC117861763 [Setaria viridis]